MSKKVQHYAVLTTCIIAALHPNEPVAINTVYAPQDEADVLEAESLALVGYVKKTDDAVTRPTWAEVRAKESEVPVVTLEDAGVTVPNSVPPVQTAGSIDAGTGTPPQDAVASLTDEQVQAFLANNADDVVAQLTAAGTYPQAQQLLDAENARDRPRKTVLAALTAALLPKE